MNCGSHRAEGSILLAAKVDLNILAANEEDRRTMLYTKPVFIGVVFVVMLPIVLLLSALFSRPLDIQDLPAGEQEVVRSIDHLGISVGTNNKSACNFGPRGHFVVQKESKHSGCHVAEFDLIPSCCVPVGHPQHVPETTINKLVEELSRFSRLRRAVLPDATEIQVEALRAHLPQCEILTRLSDARLYSSEVVINQRSN
jgi:hypothetical protein